MIPALGIASAFFHDMDYILILKALVMGVVEGLTEFLPVSSTGHLILTGDLLGGFNSEKGKVFEIAIQMGAILAVVWDYRARFASVAAGLGRDVAANRFVMNLFVAFLPLAILGLLFGKQIKALLFSPIPVASAFIIGGLIILWAEKVPHSKHIDTVEKMTWKDALVMGFCQALALIPGTSRSGATIIGGLLYGLSRKAATEFSFFLAVPTLGMASLYELYKYGHLFSRDDLVMLAVGFAASFVSAAIAVRALIRFISRHDFTVFAWYRIAFGLVILLTAYTGMVDWSAP
jgi:undecaprenyl-diphosphatase